MFENTNGQAHLKTAMRVSVLNILLNILLSVIKGIAGALTGNAVLVNDAVHSTADTLCTVFVLSGIGVQAKKPGKFAENVQKAVILLLACTIAGTGIGMAISAFDLISGNLPMQSHTPAAVFTALLCVIIKAIMSFHTAKKATHTQSDILFADAAHHRSDCLSSCLVLCSVFFTHRQLTVPDFAARLLLGLYLLASAITLAINAVKR